MSERSLADETVDQWGIIAENVRKCGHPEQLALAIEGLAAVQGRHIRALTAEAATLRAERDRAVDVLRCVVDSPYTTGAIRGKVADFLKALGSGGTAPIRSNAEGDDCAHAPGATPAPSGAKESDDE